VNGDRNPHELMSEEELRRRHKGAQSNPAHGHNSDEEMAADEPDHE
jgi:hypothetical protein